jgi:hypothetical protein
MSPQNAEIINGRNVSVSGFESRIRKSFFFWNLSSIGDSWILTTGKKHSPIEACVQETRPSIQPFKFLLQYEGPIITKKIRLSLGGCCTKFVSTPAKPP